MNSKSISLGYVSTRYIGSKRKLVGWIFKKLEKLKYQTVLDAFSGTCSVACEFKKRGKKVVCNDLLKSNYYVAVALIENSSQKLTRKDVSFILSRHEGVKYPKFIQNTFRGIYYTDQENAWLDRTVTNIHLIKNRYKKALAFYALFQSCLIKRPFNLFHRKNLYLRLARVNRTFHNHRTWERPFPEYFKKFAYEANAYIFSNGLKNKAWNLDVSSIKDTNFDLVYIDPPYISANGQGVDYHHYYHFLEGLCDYKNWSKKIDYKSKHLRLKPISNIWGKKSCAEKAFDDLFRKFQDSILVVSYRSPGFPTVSILKDLLGQYKTKIRIYSRCYKYVLSSKSNGSEILLVGI
jgi:adenine-specific DNA methylase